VNCVRSRGRALLLATWHGLSDVRLAEAINDRAGFRRFCGFGTTKAPPERKAFVRFRAELVCRGLDRLLFDLATRQLDARGLVVHTGTLVDATLIPSPVSGTTVRLAGQDTAVASRCMATRLTPPRIRRLV
jgi:IS5 family transposase